MKVVITSDLHGYLPDNIPTCDVVCICGDISPLKIQRYTDSMKNWLNTEFTDWVDSLDCSVVLLVPGNHDFIFERHPDVKLPDKVHLLIDSGVDINGKLFYGTPWCPDLDKWAFYGDHVNLMEKFSEIPENVDVLLTHCPPKVMLLGTVLQKDTFNYEADYGCVELVEALISKKPKFCFSGHVHSGLHSLVSFKDTILSNVSIKDESYEVVYEPLIIEI